MSTTDYAFMVDGVDRRYEWDEFKHEIWSDLYSCAMYNHWSYFDKTVHDYDEYGNVNPRSLGYFYCVYCGAIEPLILEHVLPRKYYPELAFDPDNIVTACPCCNRVKCNKVGPPVGKLMLPWQEQLAEKKNKKLLYRRY